MCFWFFSSSVMTFPNGNPNGSPTFMVIPSIYHSLASRLKLVFKSKFDEPNEMSRYIENNVPFESKIGTLVMTPYIYSRRYAQLLPLAQSEIDLMMPPERILEKLLEHNIGYLHLTNSPGLVPGVAAAIEPWLVKINQVPEHGNLELLKQIDYGNGAKETLYKIN